MPALIFILVTSLQSAEIKPVMSLLVKEKYSTESSVILIENKKLICKTEKNPKHFINQKFKVDEITSKMKAIQKHSDGQDCSPQIILIENKKETILCRNNSLTDDFLKYISKVCGR